ncbi:hypothetical protein PROFUN_00741 [Planoprotostelium fungivorum]|uniref:Transmembrane protein n=1 Tax=Planoprotostelium fungivorum TaxID=1890364 RepID=A0A2P6NUE1_9EUKA|nr:hypothetical protein PROFUN_00741 [Planoprotostelium fungivorum]
MAKSPVLLKGVAPFRDRSMLRENDTPSHGLLGAVIAGWFAMCLSVLIYTESIRNSALSILPLNEHLFTVLIALVIASLCYISLSQLLLYYNSSQTAIMQLDEQQRTLLGIKHISPPKELGPTLSMRSVIEAISPKKKEKRPEVTPQREESVKSNMMSNVRVSPSVFGGRSYLPATSPGLRNPSAHTTPQSIVKSNRLLEREGNKTPQSLPHTPQSVNSSRFLNERRQEEELQKRLQQGAELIANYSNLPPPQGRYQPAQRPSTRDSHTEGSGTFNIQEYAYLNHQAAEEFILTHHLGRLLPSWEENARKWISMSVIQPLWNKITLVEKEGLLITNPHIPTASPVQPTSFYSSSPTNPQQQRQNEIIAERQLIERYVSGLNPRDYVVHRIRELAEDTYMSQYKWDKGGLFRDREWSAEYPTDGQILFQLFVAHMDIHSNGPYDRFFSTRYLSTSNDMLGKNDVRLHQRIVLPPHFEVYTPDVCPVQMGQSNLFSAIALFVYWMKIKQPGFIESTKHLKKLVAETSSHLRTTQHTHVPMSYKTPYTLGGLTAAASLYAFVRTSSRMSLAGGGLIAAGLLASGNLIQAGEYTRGHQLALGSSLALTGAMAPSVVKSGLRSTRGLLFAGGLFSSALEGYTVAELSKE